MVTLFNVFDDNLTLSANKKALIDCLFDFYFGNDNKYFFHCLKNKIEKIKGKRELQSFINKIRSVVDVD